MSNQEGPGAAIAMCIVTWRVTLCPAPPGTNTVSSWLCMRLRLVVVDIWCLEPAHRGAGKPPCCCGFGIDGRLHCWSQWCKTNITSVIISETSDFHISECKKTPSFCTLSSNVTGPVWRSCLGVGSKCWTICGEYCMISHIQICSFLSERGKMKKKEKLFPLNE